MDDRGPVVLAVTAAMLAGSTFFVVLRILSRYFIVHRIKLDDWLILFAWVQTDSEPLLLHRGSHAHRSLPSDYPSASAMLPNMDSDVTKSRCLQISKRSCRDWNTPSLSSMYVTRKAHFSVHED